MRVYYYYYTFGCKANQHDTERMRQEGEARGAITSRRRSEAYVFPYSARDGIVAAALPHPVPQRVSGEREREIRYLGRAKVRVHRASRGGSIVLAVREGDHGTGVTEDCLKVRVSKPGLCGPSTRDAARARPIVHGTLLGHPDHLYIDTPNVTASIHV